MKLFISEIALPLRTCSNLADLFGLLFYHLYLVFVFVYVHVHLVAIFDLQYQVAHSQNVFVQNK